MNGQAELIERCARRRARELGGLSSKAYQELVYTIQENPGKFVVHPEEQAFAKVVEALEYNRQVQRYEEDLESEDEHFVSLRAQRLEGIHSFCEQALELDPGCLDARLLEVLCRDVPLHQQCEALCDVFDATSMPKDTSTTSDHNDADIALAHAGGEHGITPSACPSACHSACHSAWDEVYMRPYLRLEASLARACFACMHYSLACTHADALIQMDPTDALGARFTWALALARLEQEDELNALQARFKQQGNAWFYLAHVLLLYKLDRDLPAQRALKSLTTFCEGSSEWLQNSMHALPYAGDYLPDRINGNYLPDRPPTRPGSFEESCQAFLEAEAILMDTPGFIPWAASKLER